uniref:Uncharacterized protein n=1 Tax=Arundo donax TaxID=35708 RepID=A0A0A9CD38_ARUDO
MKWASSSALHNVGLARTMEVHTRDEMAT